MVVDKDYEIEWSEQAIRNFDEIVRSLSYTWGEKIVKDFVRAIDRELIHIKTFPYAFPATSQKKGVRRCVVSPINSIYYKVEKKMIYIVAIYDNRRDPGRLEDLL